MMRRWYRALLVGCLLLVATALAQEQPRQQLSREQIDERLDKEGCVSLSVKICKYDFAFEGKNVEALTFQPPGAGKFPSVLLIPGHARTARDLFVLGHTLAREGFACVAVSQPGYGKSEGPPDYVGPKTIKTLTAVYRKFQREPYNVPVSQALLLRDRLTTLKKDFEIRLFPDREHGIGPEVSTLTLDFFKRKLTGAATQK